MLQKINESAAFIKSKISTVPSVAIVLGSGLGNLSEQVKVDLEISYKDIPNFPISTVQGHKGSLIFGKLNGVNVMVMNGRFHYYEGWKMEEVVFPIRVMHALGINKVILSNAAGGMNPSFQIGDVMVIKDHINLFGNNPLMGKNYDELGPRFPSMNEAYSHKLIKLAFDVAKKHNIPLQKGVYVGVTGPCFETPAEYRAFYTLGGDAVGMSTVPEALTAGHLGLPVIGMSVITNYAAGISKTPLSDEEVRTIADSISNEFSAYVKDVVCTMNEAYGTAE